MPDPANSSPELSVIIPCRNEEPNVAAIVGAVTEQLIKVGGDYEIILIDNGSTDRTVEIVKAMCAENRRLKLIVNTRDFGQLRSPTHALFQASGRGIIGIVADFQDPPHLIPDFVERWRAGADIVLGVSETERVSPILAATRRICYVLQRNFGDYPIIPNATGFGLYDAKVVSTIAALNEPEPFFRGMLVETGYHVETVTFIRPARAAGESKNGFLALLDFALSGLAGSSKGLLRIPLYVAFFTLLLTFVTLVGAIVAALFGGSVRLWVWAGAIEVQFTLLFLFLGLIGVQVRLISDRTRGTPLVFERERINFTQDG